MTTKNDDAATDLLIKEVDEELRHEQLENLWKRYGNIFVAASVALVLAVAGWQAWNAWQVKERQASGARFSEAVQLIAGNKRDQAAELLGKLAAEGSSGYRVLAELKLGDLKQEAGDGAGAAATYERVAGMNVDEVYRNMAILKSAYLKLDAGDPLAVETMVEKLAVESSAWRHSAREVQALAALKRGDAARAAELFRKVADDPAAPQGVRARAAEMLAAAGAKPKS